MGIIPCDSDCKYQKDGYCTLESVEKVNNSVIAQGCAHYIDVKERNNINNDKSNN